MLKKTKNIFLIFLTAFGGLLSAVGLGILGGTHNAYAAEGDTISHAVCGKSDCGHDGHEEITYLPWTDATRLPSYGNYYLTRNYENVTMTVREGRDNTDADDELNLDLNGFTVRSTNTSPAIEVYTVLNVCDSSAEQTGCIVSTSAVAGTSAVRVSEGTHETFTGDIVCNNEPTSYTDGDGYIQIGYRVLNADGTIPDGEATYILQQEINGGINNGTYVLDTGRNVYRMAAKISVYGKLNFYGGKVEGQSYGINNNGRGIVNLYGGNTAGQTHGLYNNDRGTVNLYGGKVEGQTYGLYNNGRGIVTLCGGDISGNESGIFSKDGEINVSRTDGATLTVSGGVGVSATGGRINLTNGVVTGTANGLETRGSASATVTGGTITGGEYDIYCASRSAVRLENTPLFSQNPKFFVAYNSGKSQDTYMNLLFYTFTDGAGEPVDVTLYTDISNITAGDFLVNCTKAQSENIICGNEEIIFEHESNILKIVLVSARIGGVKYITLTEAFEAAALPENEGCTLTLTADSTIFDTVQVAAAYTIDLNGHKITSNFDAIISANIGADLTITDGVGGGALTNRVGDAVILNGGRVTLSSFAALSGVSVNFSSATAEDARLRLVNLPLDENNKLKITLGADCSPEEYFALSDADYSGEIDFTYAGGGSLSYVLAYVGNDGAIKLHSHSYEAEFTIDTPATCTEAGSKSKHCTGCDSTIDSTQIDATGHSWQSATCTQPRHCPSCGSTQGAALGHRWIEATCTQAKHCPVCETTEGEALGHSFGNWTVKTQPTEESEGEAEHTCSRCREKHAEALPALTSESYTKTEVGATINANAYTQYSLEIGGKTVTFRIYKEGTKLTPPQTEGGDDKPADTKTATIVGIVCVAVFVLAMGVVVLYINGVFDKRRGRR